MMLSLETLNLCAVLLSQVTLSPVADDLEEQARLIAQARRELMAALEEGAQPQPEADQ